MGRGNFWLTWNDRPPEAPPTEAGGDVQMSGTVLCGPGEILTFMSSFQTSKTPLFISLLTPVKQSGNVVVSHPKGS